MKIAVTLQDYEITMLVTIQSMQVQATMTSLVSAVMIRLTAAQAMIKLTAVMAMTNYLVG